MPIVTVQELIEAGVHFGHQAARWNPKMRPYIYGKRHKIHTINLQETIRGLYQACHFVRRLASSGAQVMFLGTKRQIRSVVEAEAKRCGMPAVTERWIGGTLTNFNTVRERLARLEELEAMEADGSMARYKKKDQATLRREMRKISRNLEGVRDLHGLPGAIVVIDPRREDNCVREAERMNVPVICILDTDCDPDRADIVIPGNDDAMSSVKLLMSRLADAVIEGRANMDEQAAAQAQQAAQDDLRARAAPGRRQQQPGGRPPRRSGGGRPGAGGGRPSRQSTGRFADRHGGHADSVSVGGAGERVGAAGEQAPPAASEAAPAPAPAVEAAPGAEAAAAPPAEAPAAEASPAEAPETPAPAEPTQAAPATESAAPEGGESKPQE